MTSRCRIGSLFCRFFGVLVTLGALAATGCSADPSNSTCLAGEGRFDCRARLYVVDQNGAQVKADAVVTWRGLQPGAQSELTFTLRNTNARQTAAPLVIEQVRIDAKDPSSNVTCLANGQPCAGNAQLRVVPQELASDGPTSASVTMRFTPTDPAPRMFVVNVHASGDPDLPGGLFRFVVVTAESSARIDVTPSTLSFDWVAAGNAETQPVVVRNTGDDDLHIATARIDGHSAFSLKEAGEWHKAGQPLKLSWTLPPKASKHLEVRYSAPDDTPRQARLIFDSDAGNKGDGAIDLLANAKAPCLQATPGQVDFQAVLVGHTAVRAVSVCNCGAGELALTTIDLGASKGDNSDEFTIAAAPQLPAKLGVNACTEVKVQYTPADVTGTDESTSLPKYDSSTLRVGIKGKHRDIGLRGYGVDSTCPHAKAIVKEGEEVIPQTLLHLVGKQSKAIPGSALKAWKWRVAKQPAGSVSLFLPGPTAPDVTFAVNVAGEYRFCLKVTDVQGVSSCNESCVKVLVIPEEAIHVELLWKTPGDPDESDEGPSAGSDLDLHFAHPMASNFGQDLDCDGKPDPWFRVPFDTFWFNEAPNWGSASQAGDDPSLDRDDTDGAGPENLNLAKPQGTVNKPFAYDVGVHYWRDHGYGDAYAEVRVYIVGQLVYQEGPVKMRAWDMWHVGRVNWPNTVTGGVLEPFVPCRQTGALCGKGAKGKKWVPKGERCMTECYDPPNMPQFNGLPAHCK